MWTGQHRKPTTRNPHSRIGAVLQLFKHFHFFFRLERMVRSSEISGHNGSKACWPTNSYLTKSSGALSTRRLLERMIKNLLLKGDQRHAPYNASALCFICYAALSWGDWACSCVCQVIVANALGCAQYLSGYCINSGLCIVSDRCSTTILLRCCCCS